MDLLNHSIDSGTMLLGCFLERFCNVFDNIYFLWFVDYIKPAPVSQQQSIFYFFFFHLFLSGWKITLIVIKLKTWIKVEKIYCCF